MEKTAEQAAQRTSVPHLPAWVGWTLALFVASTYHMLIDLHIGLYGEISSEMSVLKGGWGLAATVLMGWWMAMVFLGANGHIGALRAALLIGALEWLSNGPVAVIVAPPPSDAFPWQDISHFAALVVGALALRYTWAELRHRGRPKGGRWIVIATVVLIVISKALSAPLNLEAISSGG